MTKRIEITLGKAVPLKAIPINQCFGGGREIENLYLKKKKRKGERIKGSEGVRFEEEKRSQ